MRAFNPFAALFSFFGVELEAARVAPRRGRKRRRDPLRYLRREFHLCRGEYRRRDRQPVTPALVTAFRRLWIADAREKALQAVEDGRQLKLLRSIRSQAGPRRVVVAA